MPKNATKPKSADVFDAMMRNLDEERARVERERSLAKQKTRTAVLAIFGNPSFEMERYEVMPLNVVAEMRQRNNIDRPTNWGLLIDDLTTTIASFAYDRARVRLALADLFVEDDYVAAIQELVRRTTVMRNFLRSLPADDLERLGATAELREYLDAPDASGKTDE